MYVEVAVILPVRDTFIYSIPEEWENQNLTGALVRIPFGKRVVSGVVLGIKEKPEGGVKEEEIKPVKEVVTVLEPLPFETLEFIKRSADYYLYPVGEAIRYSLPPGVLSFSLHSLVITEEGQKHINDGSIPEDMRTILKYAQMRKSIKSISKDGRLSSSIIKNLIEKGWIDVKPLEKGRTVTPKRVKVIRLKNSPEGVSGREQIFFDFLKKNIEVDYSLVRKEFPQAYRRLKMFEGKGFIEIIEKEISRIPEIELDGEEEEIRELTPFQIEAINRISESIEQKNHEVFLVFGVTGSGKTEVYLRAIEKSLVQGRGAIYLVPEISLTPQQLLRLRKRFGDRVALLHSAMSDGERYDEWRKIRSGEKTIVVGARSAIFAPLKDPGVIIVDEEHDPSYKQEEKFRYHARDLAIIRGKLSNAVVIFGSATPSIESYYYARKGDYKLIVLPERVEKRELPEVEIVDMRNEKDPLLSEKLKQGIIETINKKEQVILFLNRRGFAPFVLCVECGYRFTCPNCSVSLVYHSYNGSLRCHYCNYSILLPDVCPSCRGVKLRNFGFGTERVEKEIERLTGSASVLRLDRDTTGKKSSFTKAFMQMQAGEKNVLIGTQMVTKGFHFPSVTLVGVILAEQGLQFPDFRASERTFQLLTQVGGRAGRGNKKGRVIIQTYDPEQPAIRSAGEREYELFYNNEIHFRQELNYPPFSCLTALRISGKSQNSVKSISEEVADILKKMINDHNLSPKVLLLGPAPSALYKLKNIYRWMILLKAESVNHVHTLLNLFLEQHGKRYERYIIIDINPHSMI